MELLCIILGILKDDCKGKKKEHKWTALNLETLVELYVHRLKYAQYQYQFLE
jgi:hypothetical protein